MNKWLKIVSIITIVVTVGVVTMFTIVSAQEPTEAGGFPGQGRGGPGFGPRAGFSQNADFDFDFKALHQETLADVLGISIEALEAARAEGQSLRDLAEAQGIDIADIHTALEAARQAVLDQAVANGDLTQGEADQLLQGRPGRRQGRPDGAGQGGFIPDEALRDALKTETQAALAAVLGISVEELEAAKAAGESLRDLAEAQEVELTDVQAAIQTATQTVLDQAVADGTLTQEEADQFSERLERSGPRRGPRGNQNGNRDGNRGGNRGFGGPPNQQ